MDIEGAEIEWLNSLDEKHMDKFAQIVIEFHSPDINQTLHKINRTHVLIHIHGNNCCGVANDDRHTPNVFECTYIHKRFMQKPYALNKMKLPGPLDQPNLDNIPEIPLDHYPFVSK